MHDMDFIIVIKGVLCKEGRGMYRFFKSNKKI